jgi:hypothetical protein
LKSPSSASHPGTLPVVGAAAAVSFKETRISLAEFKLTGKVKVWQTSYIREYRDKQCEGNHEIEIETLSNNYLVQVDELQVLFHKFHQNHPPEDFGIYLQLKEYGHVYLNRKPSLGLNHKDKALSQIWK